MSEQILASEIAQKRSALKMLFLEADRLRRSKISQPRQLSKELQGPNAGVHTCTSSLP